MKGRFSLIDSAAGELIQHAFEPGIATKWEEVLVRIDLLKVSVPFFEQLAHRIQGLVMTAVKRLGTCQVVQR